MLRDDGPDDVDHGLQVSWGRGQVPQGQTVSAQDVNEASEACASGIALPFASTLTPLIFLCAEKYCDCLSPDDPSAALFDTRTCPPRHARGSRA